MKIDELSERQIAVHQRLQTDLEFYCKKALKITTKSGKLVPFIWNKAQRYIHERIEAQYERLGFVRVVILKGRQQGCSTYVTGRYFNKSSWFGHKSVYILSHEGASTQTLLGKVNGYFEFCPEQIRPELKIGNKNELRFDNGSSYKVGTAGAKNTGRSQTVQYFHGSEVAFYENTDEIASGVLQTVSDEPDTEIILESTANGVGDFFHKTCMDALKGRGVYELIFVPWYWQDEYTADVPPGWDFTSEELELKELYGLTDGQLYWRYLKIIALKSETLFKQEYPFTVAEAFQSSTTSFIKPEAIHRARKCNITDTDAPIAIGVDPGRSGDRTVISYRRGREFFEVRKYNEMTTTRLAGILARDFQKMNVGQCFIDFGLGVGTYDILEEMGYGKLITLVHFGGRPIDPSFLNKRVEMAFDLRDWLDEGECSIPDDEDIEADLLAIPDFKQNSRTLKYLEPKDKIKELYGKSPDIFDSMILTFAEPLARESTQQRKTRYTENVKKGSALSTLSRVRSLGKKPGGDSWEDDDDALWVSHSRRR